MDATYAALLGAVIGGMLSVLASWLAQRVQTRAQWLSQEIRRRQQLYSDFVEAVALCYADALQTSEPSTARLAKLYGDIGRIRLLSTDQVIKEANRIAHQILDTYAECNRSGQQIRDFLARDSIDLFTDFGNACRIELSQLQPHRIGLSGPSEFRLTPVADEPVASRPG